jgi:L-malate glycosyltransferase
MKIMVFVDRLIIGGVPVNSIELSTMLRDLHGHDVVLFGTPGPLIEFAKEKGLRFLPAPYPRTCPSVSRMRALCEAVRRERPDLIQVWDWRAVLDAYYSAHLLMRVPMHVVMSTMKLDRLLPKALPTTLMTPELVDEARAVGRRPVELLLPPVDIHLNAPGAADPQPIRERYGIRDDEITLVTVSRLDEYLKAESLFQTLDAVNTLGRDLPLRFVVVGDGDVRTELERKAGKINSELGRDAVVFTGALLDPRPAYAAADIVVGMGGSALRGMAFGKPVIIVGENGFSAPFTPETAETFYYKGMYGSGDGTSENNHLVADIRGIAERPEHWSLLGDFSRQFVERNFSLEQVSLQLNKFCHASVANAFGFHITMLDGLRTAAVFLAGRVLPRKVITRLSSYTRPRGLAVNATN